MIPFPSLHALGAMLVTLAMFIAFARGRMSVEIISLLTIAVIWFVLSIVVAIMLGRATRCPPDERADAGNPTEGTAPTRVDPRSATGASRSRRHGPSSMTWSTRP